MSLIIIALWVIFAFCFVIVIDEIVGDIQYRHYLRNRKSMTDTETYYAHEAELDAIEDFKHWERENTILPEPQFYDHEDDGL